MDADAIAASSEVRPAGFRDLEREREREREKRERETDRQTESERRETERVRERERDRERDRNRGTSLKGSAPSSFHWSGGRNALVVPSCI